MKQCVCLFWTMWCNSFLSCIFQYRYVVSSFYALYKMNNIETSLVYSKRWHSLISKVKCMSILLDYAAFFLFSFTFGANHESPSTNPSPLTAQQDWMYQSWPRMLRKSSFSVNSEGEAAFGKSCLFAKTSNVEFLKRSSCIRSWSSSLTSTNLSLSHESTTHIRASLFSK